jgi:hypothetical protein
MTATVAFAQKGKHPPPPAPPPPLAVIAKVTAAKKIFVSNAGEDPEFIHEIPGGPNVTYDEFYAALKQWGYFQLVDSAAQADLIFQIKGAEITEDTEHTGMGVKPDDYATTVYPALLNLSILDPSQHLVYKIVLPAGRAGNIPKGKIAFAKSIEALTDKVKALVAAPAPTQNP